MNKIVIESRYSETDTPDKIGRWARKFYYNDLHIAWVRRLEVQGEIAYSVTTYFPVSGNDNPLGHGCFSTYQLAQEYVEFQFDKFVKKIMS